MSWTRWALVLLVPLVFGACGSGEAEKSGPEGSVGPSTTSRPAVAGRTDKSVPAAPPGAPVVGLICCKYSPTEVTVSASAAVLFLVNLQSDEDLNQVVRAADLQHDLLIVGSDGLSLAQSDRLALGERATFTVTGLRPGSYEFYCTLRGHAAQGMRGTLTVEA